MKIELLYITPNAERLIERIGRLSHKSEDRITRESYKDFILKLIQMGHESVLEHAFASFLISGVSRALTHQLVRHRLASYTQKSQRYTKETKFKYVTPETIEKKEEAKLCFTSFMEYCQVVYNRLIELGIPKEDARYVLPNATETEIVVTMNFRELRHVIKERGSKKAQWEIRQLVIEMLKILKQKAPTVFQDFEIKDNYVELK